MKRVLQWMNNTHQVSFNRICSFQNYEIKMEISRAFYQKWCAQLNIVISNLNGVELNMISGWDEMPLLPGCPTFVDALGNMYGINGWQLKSSYNSDPLWDAWTKLIIIIIINIIIIMQMHSPMPYTKQLCSEMDDYLCLHSQPLWCMEWRT